MGTGLRLAGRACLVAGLAFAVSIAARGGIADDYDFDGIPGIFDKCMFDSRNVAASCDTDVDGYGNPCDADFDQNFSTLASDFGTFFIPAFKGGSAARGQDMDCNGLVNAVDFGSYFVPKFKGAPALGGSVPGPSGLACAGQQGCQ